MKHRRQVRNSFEAWCRAALEPLGHEPASHHLLLIRELEALARGDVPRLMVFMPPGSAKSTYTSVLFPAWFLAQAPNLNVIAASHTATLAETFSGRVQSQVAEHSELLGYGLATEAKDRWRTTNGGEYLAAGVGGAVTGFRADLAVIDDPVRSRKDADSETMRETAWNWYLADLTTRLKPGGRVAIVMTRWHEDDLAGRLLLQFPDQWRVVSLPAEAMENDPLGRAVGAPLWSDGTYGYGAELAAKKATYEAGGSMRDWWALYQQTPRNPDGALFKVARLGTVEARPAGGRVVRAWDLAATAAADGRNPDWTAGVLLARIEDRYVVLDVVRLRGGPEDVRAAIQNTAAQDGRGVTVCLPQDPGQAGKVQAADLVRMLAGYVVEVTPETGDKATRAAPAASQVNVGNVSLVAGAWNRPFIEELRDFPTGAKDDQVDALSRAFGRLTNIPAPARRATIPMLGR